MSAGEGVPATKPDAARRAGVLRAPHPVGAAAGRPQTRRSSHRSCKRFRFARTGAVTPTARGVPRVIVAPSPVPTLDTCRAAAPDRRGPEGQRAMPDEKTATSFMSVIDTACIRPWARGLREPDAALSCRSIGTCALAPGAARLQRPSDATHQDIQAADRRDRAINSLPLRVIPGFVAHRGGFEPPTP